MSDTYRDSSYFERLYAEDPDPWKFATSDYERDKYAETLAVLPPRRFTRCFEVGCSIGVLTRQLAARCDTLLGVDVADGALDQARARCADLGNVAFANMSVPKDWPEGKFDLIIFSEVLYYLGFDGMEEAARRTMECLSPGGVVVLVDWHGDTDGACNGDVAAETFIRHCQGLRLGPQSRADLYRVDVLTRG